jgi:hypothetical protein
VVWLSSFGLELFAAKDIGISLDNLDYQIPKSATERYGISKCVSWALGVEFARRHKADGIISLPINPGNLTSDLARDQPMSLKIAARVLGYPTVMGACTELFAAFSPEVTIEKSGDWGEYFILSNRAPHLSPVAQPNLHTVVPFGRFYPLRQDLPKATLLEAEGGTGGAYKFWEWTENEVKQYL